MSPWIGVGCRKALVPAMIRKKIRLYFHGSVGWAYSCNHRGGGLFVYLIQFAVSQLVLIPNIEIYYNPTDPEFILSNIGLSSATKAVITIDWKVSITTSPTLLSTNYVQNESIKFSTVDNESWQVLVPRISPGAASSYLIEVPSKPVALYITYDQGSEIWPPSKLRDNTTYFWIFIIAGFSTASFAAALLYR